MQSYTLPNSECSITEREAMPLSPASDSLFTDLYQLTMAQSYYQNGQTQRATFSLFFRNFPPSRAYYVFCGLESALDYLEALRFDEEDIASLNGLEIFDTGFLDFLRQLRFTGDVRAMREGEVFFENEPVMEVSGPIIECQLVETFLLNQINLESMLATKAARVVDASSERSVVDFAARRTHGQDSAMKTGQILIHSGLRRDQQRRRSRLNSAFRRWARCPTHSYRRSRASLRRFALMPDLSPTRQRFWWIHTTRWAELQMP